MFLEYCFPDIYGPNFGFSTLIELEDECVIGESCTDSGESISADDNFDSAESGMLFLFPIVMDNIIEIQLRLSMS